MYNFKKLYNYKNQLQRKSFEPVFHYLNWNVCFSALQT